MNTKVIVLLAILVLGTTSLPVSAGEGIDNLRTVLNDSLTGLRSQTVTDSKARAQANKAERLFVDALANLALGDAASGKRAFKAMGKGIRALKKAVRRQRSAEFIEFVAQTSIAIWTASLAVFVPSDIFIPGSEEEEKLLNQMGNKLKKALSLAAKGKLGKAVQKLAKPYTLLLQIFPSP